MPPQSCRSALAVLVLAVLCGSSTAPPSSAQSLQGSLRSDGQFVRDRFGRVALLRGMNYSGLEFGNFFSRPRPPEEADFAQMAGWGVNVIRLPIAWRYLEPEPGRIDVSYLTDQVDRVIELARRHGIDVVIDMHQFNWSPCVGGLGAPAWTCANQGYPQGQGGAFLAQIDFWNGALAPDGRPLTEHLIDVWEVVASHYRASPSVIGFNLFNEPFGIPSDPAVPSFEKSQLYPFYRKAVARIRGVGAGQMIVLDPPVTRNVGFRVRPQPIDDPNLLFAPHLYTGNGGADDVGYNGDRSAVDRDYAQAIVEAGEQKGVLWIGEYGGVVYTPAFLTATELFVRHSLEEQEERFVGSVWWAYFPSDNGFSIVDAAGREKGQVADLWTRPYPLRTAGVPKSLHYDPDTHELEYVFNEDRTRFIPDPTVLFVPLVRHYPGGVAIETSPGDVATLDAATNRITLRRSRANAEHRIRLRPAGHPN